MTKEEFLSKINLKEISNNDFEKINFVYTFHPAISETDGKEQIARLFLAGGMSVIQDMLPRAEIQKKLEDKMIKVNGIRKELEEIIEENQSGASISEIKDRANTWLQKYKI